MARRQTRTKGPLHDDSLLMIPPPGFKFIPKSDQICGKAGCFECFDIYCERCESKDRRIVELEMRNNDLVKYITQLQAKLFKSPSLLQRQLGPQAPPPAAPMPTGPSGWPVGGTTSNETPAPDAGSEPFAFIQSPVLYDPSMNLSYVATTSFAPAPVDYFSRPTAPDEKA